MLRLPTARFFFLDCPERECHVARFQHYVNLGNFVTYIMDHTAHDVDDEGLEMLEYFPPADDQMTDTADDCDDDEETMDAWMDDMFAVLDNTEAFTASIPYSADPSMTYNSYGFILMLLTELMKIVKILTLFSSTSADQHMLLDKSAPHFIYGVDWLEKANLAPLQKVELPANKPPFCFAGTLSVRCMASTWLQTSLTLKVTGTF